jgi:hypothetical protein
MLPQEKAGLKSAVKVHPVNGFDNIVAAGDALKQTIRLRREVDSITSKKHLSKSDSLSLLRDLDSLQHIRIILSH